MFKGIIKSIPNTITCLNLLSGCIAAVMAFQGRYDAALLFVLLSAVFDFFDGLAARALKAFSVIGKDIDSLADDISFGFVPGTIVYSLLGEMDYSGFMASMEGWFPYLGFLIAAFSALRLAKFNNDTRQTCSFIGLAVPANALLWASLASGCHDWILGNVHPLLLLAGIILSCYLLVSEIPMFSLKFKSLRWKGNEVPFIFLLGCLPMLLLGRSAFFLIIIWYILLSVTTIRKSNP